ncbi:MAG: DUF697 domain-containing protein [Acidobacteriota bacterium]
MLKDLSKILVPVAALVILGFVIFLVSQTAQVVELASLVHPTLGRVVLIALLAAYALLIGLTTFRYLRLPAPLKPPAKDSGPAFERHLRSLKRRLERNPCLAGQPDDLTRREGIEQAISQLDGQAEQIIRTNASMLFLATAISQSGRLDGLVVLAAQTRMVFQVAKVYNQRPALREMLRLYANVAATAFVARELEDSEVSDMVGSMLAASVGTVAGAVPGLQAASSVLVNSVLEGAANAFLTLRVGLIARSYSGALLQPDPKALRRSASLQALRLLGRIVSQGARTISSAAWDVSKDKARGAFDSLRNRFSTADPAPQATSPSQPAGESEAFAEPNDPSLADEMKSRFLDRLRRRS